MFTFKKLKQFILLHPLNDESVDPKELHLKSKTAAAQVFDTQFMLRVQFIDKERADSLHRELL